MKKKIFFLLLFLTIFVFPKSVMATTATPTFKKKLTWNIESVYYYLTSTATDYSNLIRDAADNWVQVGIEGRGQRFQIIGYILDMDIINYIQTQEHLNNLMEPLIFLPIMILVA